jgi:hypothetical protein
VSYHFYVKTAARPVVEEVLALVPGDGLGGLYEGAESDDEDSPVLPSGEWPEWVHFHRVRRSTRGVGVRIDDDGFDIALNTMASPEDCQLAIDLATALGKVTSQSVLPEDSEEPIDVSELRARFGEAWAQEHSRWGADVTLRIAAEKGPVTLGGPYRPFHVGPRLIAQLRTPGDSGADQRLMDAMRRAQYAHLDGWFCANVMGIQAGNDVIKVTPFGPEVAYLFPAVQFLVLMPNDKDLYYLPYERLPEVAASHFEWLDESQALVKSHSYGEYKSLIERARPYLSLQPGGPALPPGGSEKRKWWWPFGSQMGSN